MEKKPFVLRMSDDLAERVDDWRATRRPVPTKAEAIRQLTEAALDAAGIGLKVKVRRIPPPDPDKPPHT